MNHHGREQSSHGLFHTSVPCDVRRVARPCSLFSFLSRVRISCQCFTCQWSRKTVLARGSWLARAIHILVSQRRKRCYRVPQRRWVGKDRPAVNPTDRQGGAQFLTPENYPDNWLILGLPVTLRQEIVWPINRVKKSPAQRRYVRVWWFSRKLVRS